MEQSNACIHLVYLHPKRGFKYKNSGEEGEKREREGGRGEGGMERLFQGV